MMIRGLAAASILVAVMIGPAAASDPVLPSAPATEDQTAYGWTFTVATYGWLAGLEGRVGARGRMTHIDASVGDILSNLDIAVMGLAEARYDRFGIFTDINYVRLSSSGDTPFGALASSVDFETQSLMWTVAGEYRLFNDPDASVDAFAGFRLFSLKNELRFNPPGALGGTVLTQKETWADPIVGLKARMNVSSNIYLTGWGMIGGGASSDLVWDVMGGVGYQFKDQLSAVAGYRAAGVDYENNGFVYDAVQHGPILGLVYRF